MIYDLHVHINPHADAGEIYEYDMYAKMRNMDIVGFVIHYTPKIPEKTLRNFRDMISTFSIKSLVGVELYYPPRKIPSGFDYHLYHFSNITLEADMLRNAEKIIIAHPFAYGMYVPDDVLDILNEKNIAVEYNSAHFTSNLIGFYKKCKERGIDITFGSDAHSPQEIGEGFEKVENLITPYEKLRIFR